MGSLAKRHYGEHVLSVRLLGRISAEIDGHELKLTGRHAQALFALLALQPRARSREALAAELWPDSDCSSSAALRQALWLVRGAIAAVGIDADDVIEADQDAIGLRSTVRLVLDTALFERLVRGEPAEPEQAIGMYKGELAEGICHECFATDRERLSDAFEDALALAAQSRLTSRDLHGARAAAEQLLGRDLLREEAHEVIIRVYGAIGSRSQVHRQYRRLREVLEREIGVEPLPETAAAYRAAIAETVERSRRRVASTAFVPPPVLAAAFAQTG